MIILTEIIEKSYEIPILTATACAYVFTNGFFLSAVKSHSLFELVFCFSFYFIKFTSNRYYFYLVFMDKKILIYRIVVARAVFVLCLSRDKAPAFGILRFNPHASTDLEAYLKINSVH